MHYAEWLTAQSQILKSARQDEALRAITAELGNVRAMWRWAVQQQDVAMVRQATETLHWFYEVCGWNAEGRAMFGAAAEALRPLVEDGSSATERLRATYWLLVTLEGWHTIRSDPATGIPRLFAGLEGQRTAGDPWALALCLVTVAYVQIFVSAYESAQAMLDEAEVISERSRYTWVLSVARVVRGVLETLRSDPETARRHLHAALVTARAVGDPRHVSLTLNYLGLTALSLGQHDEAERVCQECLAIAQPHQDRYQTSLALQSLGRVAIARGRHEEAEALIDESLAIAREMGDHWLEAQALGYLGQLAMARGDGARARVHRRSALRVASTVPQPIALDALAALADLELATQPDAALTALAYVRQHPLSRPAARALAEQHWRDVWRELPAERCIAAETAAKSFPPETPAALLALFGRENAAR
jgi:tetratricopeptide (TPR) repeat protein